MWAVSSSKRALATAAVALAVASCGSTVQMGSGATAAGEGLSGPTSNGSAVAGTVANPLNGGQGAATTGDGSAGGSLGSGGQQAPGTLTSSGSTASTAAVARNAPIRVGVIYSPGVDKAAAAMGISALQTGDTKAEAAAVVNWINQQGGLGGHRIQLFSYATDMSASSPDQVQQEACTAMTQDDKVRFVVTIISNVDALAQCLANAHVGLLDDESGLADAAMAKYASFLGNPGEIAPGRMESVLVDDLWKRGWLTSHSKVGILATDSPDGHAVVDTALSPALRRHGLTAVSTQYVNPNGGDGGSAQSSSASLKFRSAGVDRVIPVLYNPLFMMEAASSQDYHPAYAMYSLNGPGALMESTAPKDQLANSAGIGWQPFLDIGSGTQPPPVSSRETLCFNLMKKAGQATTSATAKGFQVQVCNVLFYLKDLSDLEPTVPLDLLTSARELIGKKFVSADTFRTDVTHRTDGVAGYRDLTYEQNCSCFQYTSAVESTS